MRARRILAVPMVVALMSAAACGSGSGAKDSGGGGEMDRSATLKVAISFLPSSMDPHKATSSLASHVYTSLFYDRLTEIGDGLTTDPLLAESWEFAEDGKQVTFTLRDDASFWDGTPVDAAAVKASLDRARTVEGTTAAPALSMIESVEAPEARTVVISTNRPAADLPAALAGIEGAIINPSALDNPDLDQKPVGSGPYELAERVADTVALTRSADYWDEDAQKAERIEVTGIPNDNARLSALRSGQVDLAMTTAAQYDEATKIGDGFTTHEYAPASPYTVYLNSGLGDLADVRVRQALNWAVDRQAISDTLLSGKCEPSGQLLGSVYDGHLESPEVDYSHDPEKAKALLGEAGVTDLSVKVLVPAGLTLYEQIGTAIQAQLEEVGVTVDLELQDAAQLFPNWAAAKTYGGFVNARATKPSATSTLETYLNPARYPGPVPDGFEALVRKAQDPSLSAAELTEVLGEANGLTASGAMDVYICNAPALWTAKDTVVGADEMGWSGFSAHGDLRYVGIRS